MTLPIRQDYDPTDFQDFNANDFQMDFDPIDFQMGDAVDVPAAISAERLGTGFVRGVLQNIVMTSSALFKGPSQGGLEFGVEMANMLSSATSGAEYEPVTDWGRNVQAIEEKLEVPAVTSGQKAANFLSELAPDVLGGIAAGVGRKMVAKLPKAATEATELFGKGVVRGAKLTDITDPSRIISKGGKDVTDRVAGIFEQRPSSVDIPGVLKTEGAKELLHQDLRIRAKGGRPTLPGIRKLSEAERVAGEATPPDIKVSFKFADDVPKGVTRGDIAHPSKIISAKDRNLDLAISYHRSGNRVEAAHYFKKAGITNTDEMTRIARHTDDLTSTRPTALRPIEHDINSGKGYHSGTVATTPEEAKAIAYAREQYRETSKLANDVVESRSPAE